MQHKTGSAKWQKQAPLVIISREKPKKNLSISLWNTPSSLSSDRVLTYEIVGVDKHKVSLMARLHEPLRNRSHLCLQLFPYPSQRKQKHLTVCQTWKPSNYSERWGDSNLCNKKFSIQRRGWTFSPPLSDSALEPSSQNSHQRKSAASRNLWVMWSYVCMTLTQTQTFGFVRLHVT